MDSDFVAERGQALAALANVANGTSNSLTLAFLHAFMALICESVQLPPRTEGEVIPIRVVKAEDDE